MDSDSDDDEMVIDIPKITDKIVRLFEVFCLKIKDWID